MCRCKTLRERVAFLEAALGEAEWDLRYQAVIGDHDRDSPDRRIQLVVAGDLARARLGMLQMIIGLREAAPDPDDDETWGPDSAQERLERGPA